MAGETIPILTCQSQQQLYESAFVGLAAALQQNGLNSRSRTLTESIHRQLNKLD